MADIQQWRRMIQPTPQVRTPAIDLDDSDGITSPVTARRGIGPKLSSYFSQHALSGNILKPESSFASLNAEVIGSKLPSWPEDEPFPEPMAEILIDLIMCQLMSNPYDPLEVRFNGVLLQIFERFRALSDEKVQLLNLLNENTYALERMEQSVGEDRKLWLEERQVYKAEVKRLELLLANGKRGLAEVTIARQDSVLRQRNERKATESADDGLETIFEFLEKTKRMEDQTWSSQRAALRTRAPSPSAQMRRLSRRLESQDAMPNLHTDSPFSAPPDALPSTLAQASLLEQQAAKVHGQCIRSTSDATTSLSDGSRSVFSWPSDFLFEELVVRQHSEATGAGMNSSSFQRAADDSTYDHHIATYQVVPTLLDRSNVHHVASARSTSVPNILGVREEHFRSEKTTSTLPGMRVRKQPSLIAKASGFFQRLKPSVVIDTIVDDRRRFSFEAGDDDELVMGSSSTAPVEVPANDGGSLRKSVFLSKLSELGQGRGTPGRTRSPQLPEAMSCTPSTETQRTSRIPTPVYRSRLLARPRQERDNSSSSLLTAIKLVEDTSQRSRSTGSSAYSSPSTSHMVLRPQNSEPAPSNTHGSALSNRLLVSHTAALCVSPRPARVATNDDIWCTNADGDHDLQPGMLRNVSRSVWSGDSSRFMLCLGSEMSEVKKESTQPIESFIDMAGKS